MLRYILLLTCLAVFLPMLGCNGETGQSAVDLELEKLRLEVMRAQREEMDSLIDVEKRIRAENVKTAQKLDRRYAELQQLEKTIEQKQQDLRTAQAKTDTQRKLTENRLNTKEAELEAMETKNKELLQQINAKKREISSQLSSLKSKRGPIVSPTVAGTDEISGDHQNQTKGAGKGPTAVSGIACGRHHGNYSAGSHRRR